MTPPFLSFWAMRWGLPPEALVDLMQTLGGLAPVAEAANDASPRSESAIQSLVRLEAARKGLLLWRNNVGAGRFISDSGVETHMRFGLANDSKKVNEVLKSADLIGIRPITIGQQHVGQVIGQFVSREIKAGDWRWTGSPREIAQMNWASLVASLGGDAQIVNKEGSL